MARRKGRVVHHAGGRKKGHIVHRARPHKPSKPRVHHQRAHKVRKARVAHRYPRARKTRARRQPVGAVSSTTVAQEYLYLLRQQGRLVHYGSTHSQRQRGRLVHRVNRHR